MGFRLHVILSAVKNPDSSSSPLCESPFRTDKIGVLAMTAYFSYLAMPALLTWRDYPADLDRIKSARVRSGTPVAPLAM